MVSQPYKLLIKALLELRSVTRRGKTCVWELRHLQRCFSKISSFQTLHGLRTEEELNEEYMGNEKEGKASDSKRGEGRKRLRDGGSQTDEEDLMAPGRSTSARLDEMNAKLDKVLAVCGEI